MPAKSIKFEEALAKLEDITRQLERGTLKLDEAILAYEEGMKLSELCHNMLKKAERKLEYIEQNEHGDVEHKSINKANEDETKISIGQKRLFQNS